MVVGPGQQPVYKDTALGLNVRSSHVGEILAMLQYRHDSQAITARGSQPKPLTYNPDVVVMDINDSLLPDSFLPGLFPRVDTLTEEGTSFYPELEPVLTALRHGFPQTDIPLDPRALEEELHELLPQLAPSLVAPNRELAAIKLNSFHGDITHTTLPTSKLDVVVIKNVLEYALLNLRIIHPSPHTYLDEKNKFTEQLLASLSTHGSLILDGFSLANLLENTSRSLHEDVNATAAFRDKITWDGHSQSSAKQVNDILNTLAGDAKVRFKEIGFDCDVTPNHNILLSSDITFTVTMRGPASAAVIYLGGAVQPGYVPPIQPVSPPNEGRDAPEPNSHSLKDQIVHLSNKTTGKGVTPPMSVDLTQFGSMWQLSFPIPLSRTAYARSILHYDFGPSPNVMILGPGKTDLHEGVTTTTTQLPPSSTEPYEIAAMLRHGATGSYPDQVVIVDIDPDIESGKSSALPDTVLKLDLPPSLNPHTRMYYTPVVDAMHNELAPTKAPIDTSSLRTELAQFEGVDTLLHQPSEGLRSIDWQPLHANIHALTLPKGSFNLITGRNTLYYVVLDMLAASPDTFKEDNKAFLNGLVHALKPKGVLIMDIISLWALTLGETSDFKSNIEALNDAYIILSENRSPTITQARFQQNLDLVKKKMSQLAAQLKGTGLKLTVGNSVNPSSPDDIAILIRRDA
jgi:hypothetical protein